MNKIELKEWYAHEHESSIFVMFNKRYELIWCPSGNELRRIHLIHPEEFLSGPIELPVTPEIYQMLVDHMDDF